MIYTNGSTSADALGARVEAASTEVVKESFFTGECGVGVYVLDTRTNPELSQVKSDRFSESPARAAAASRSTCPVDGKAVACGSRVACRSIAPARAEGRQHARCSSD